MAKIKITDLPKNLKITREEMRRACGGWRVRTAQRTFAAVSMAQTLLGGSRMAEPLLGEGACDGK